MHHSQIKKLVLEVWGLHKISLSQPWIANLIILISGNMMVLTWLIGRIITSSQAKA
jgi:hypothetical protein